MSQDPKAFSLDRRAFIAATSVAVAGMAAPQAFAASPVAGTTVSVGYFGGVATVARRGGARQTLIAAERLTTSDPALIQSGARISVRGLWQRPERVGRLGTYSLEVRYAVHGVEEKVPFYAWMHSVTKNGPTGSAANSFVAPVDSNGTVDLSVRRIFGEELVTQISFAVTSRPDAYMLDRGAYVIAFVEPGERLPDWSSVELVPEATAMNYDQRTGLLRVRSITGNVPPSFDYLVVTFGSNTPVERQKSDVEGGPVTES